MTEFVSGPPGQYVTLPNFRVCARQKVPAKCFKIVDIWPGHTLGEDIKEHKLKCKKFQPNVLRLLTYDQGIH